MKLKSKNIIIGKYIVQKCEKKEKKPCAICAGQPCICEVEPLTECDVCGNLPCSCKKKVKIRLKGGKELEIQHTTQTMFWDASGKPITSEEFLNNLFGEIPHLFKSEAELRYKLNATIEKVEDIQEIMKYNVLSTPALVINDRVSIPDWYFIIINS